MKNIAKLGSIGILIALAACSSKLQHTVSTSTPSTRQAANSQAGTPSSEAAAAPLAVPLAGVSYGQTWRPEPVDDHLGGAIVLKRASRDGKYDLVVEEKGAQAFLSFASHGRWDSVYNQPAKGKLMYLRLKFEDGMEKRAEWDELAYGTENMHSMLWSYPASADAPVGPVTDAAKSEPQGGDQLLMEDLMKHKTVLVEIEPGVTTQFDLAGLQSEMGKIRFFKPEPVLSASQDAQ
jgi:hypothetical protein